MVNGLLDFGPDDGLQGFVGGGVGAREERDLHHGLFNAGGVDDSSAGFAYQILTGIRAPISKNVDLGLKYRYFVASGANHFTSSAGASVVERMHSHSLLATLTYNFGRRPRRRRRRRRRRRLPRRRRRRPLRRPPPPPAGVQQGPYIVFFDWDKADITPQAAAILDSAIQAYGNCGSAPIVLAGYADRSGTVKYNLACRLAATLRSAPT
jgi:hypothetical protein